VLLVLARAKKELDAGCDGVIASACEAPMIREIAGNKLMIVTPGIRPAGSLASDQKKPQVRVTQFEPAPITWS